MTTTTRTADEIRAEIAALEGELATLAGKGLEIWSGQNEARDVPPGGALLDVSWAVSDASYQEWYPTTEAAKASLLALARREGCAPRGDGLYVDLTAPGCQSSSAWVTRRSKPEMESFGYYAPDEGAPPQWIYKGSDASRVEALVSALASGPLRITGPGEDGKEVDLIAAARAR